jgi:hypothetical protein
MKNNDLSLNETHRRRNRLIGAVTLLALALIFCISLFFKNRQQVDEADILRRADLGMAAAPPVFARLTPGRTTCISRRCACTSSTRSSPPKRRPPATWRGAA